jgi:hypothetical protein
VGGGGGGTTVVIADAALSVAMQEDPEQGGVEQGVEEPGADAAAAAVAGAEVHPDDADVAGEVAAEQRELAGERDGRGPGGARGREARPDPEAESEGDGVRERGRKDGEYLERLRELEPEEGHGDGGGVSEDPRDAAPAAAQHGEDAPRGVEVARQVVGVGPEEDAAGGARPRREAEQPAEGRGAAAAAPGPARVPYLRHRRQQRAGEDDRRDGRHEQRVGRRDGAQRERPAAAQRGEEGGEGEAERHVGGEEAEEEGPGGEPQVGGAPPEPDDGRVLGQPEGGGAQNGHGKEGGGCRGCMVGKGFGEDRDGYI